jgi:hypothetical protein
MLTDEEIERKAKLGYEAYGAFTEWKNYAGLPMPQWTDLTDKIRGAWCASTKAILESK